MITASRWLLIPVLFLCACSTISAKRNPALSERSQPDPEEGLGGSKEMKKYFRNVSTQVRKDAIARAEIFDPTYDPAYVGNRNIVEELQRECGPLFQLSAKEIGQDYNWNQVTCEYHPDSEKKMSGGSKKYLCDFKSISSKGKEKTLTAKVKYASDDRRPLDGEVVETIIASELAKLLGFPSNTYCPAVIKCVGCPSSDPWADRRSQRAAKPGQSYQMAWAIVEKPIDADAISVANNQNAPSGIDWSEIAHVTQTSAKKLIDREAWMLWVHFLQHTDAAFFNHHIACSEGVKTESGDYYCTAPFIYTHDYGQAFYRHLHFNEWDKLPALRSDGQACYGGMTRSILPGGSPLRKSDIPGNALFLNAKISSEARDILLERMSRISDEQWITLFNLARAEKATGVSADRWLATVKRKMQEMKLASCQPFSSGESVLYHGLQVKE